MKRLAALSAFVATVLMPLAAHAAQTARHQGYIVVAETMCPEVEIPVCATKNGQRKTYGNACKAERDGATNITSGACEAVR